MKYLLDSDICIDALANLEAWPIEEIRSIGPESLSISVITFGEVHTGILFSRNAARDHVRWRRFLRGVDVVDVTQEVADIWAQLRGWLRQRGQIVGDNDLLIAATALEFEMTLLSRNLRHFVRVPGLDLLVPVPPRK